MIVIIDYKMGNLFSVFKTVKKITDDVTVSSLTEDINKAKKLILPGVGHFGKGMENINNLGLLDVINENVLVRKKPILGICLGMQLFTKHSEEGNCTGLGYINAVTKKFSFDNNHFKIPHMGWNNLAIVKEKGSLLHGINMNDYFYFVHSYYATREDLTSEDNDFIASTTFYGNDFISSVEQNNIFGTQFHPEKSLKTGNKIIANFINL